MLFTAIHETIRVEGHAEGDALVVRLFLGDRELEVTPPLRGAVLRLLQGAPTADDLRVLQERGVVVPLPDEPVPERLQLRRTVRLSVEPAPQIVRAAGASGPLQFMVAPEELTREGFVPRHWLGPLHKLGEAVREAAVHRPAPSSFAALVDAVFADIPALDAFLHRTPHGLEAVVPLQRDTLQYDLQLHFLADRDPVLARRAFRFSLHLEPAEMGAIGEAVAALQYGVHGLDLKRSLQHQRLAKNLILGLISRRMVAEPAPPTSWENGTHYLGRGCIYEHRSCRLVVDPWFPVGSHRDPVAPQLPKPRLALFTRAPHPSTLFRLERGLPVVVATPRGPAPLADKTAELFRALGFVVTEVPEGGAAVVDGVAVEHHPAGVLYTIDGEHTLVGRDDGGPVPRCDRLFTRPVAPPICSRVAGLFEPFERWLDPVERFGEAAWERAGRPVWWLLDVEPQGRSATRRWLDGQWDRGDHAPAAVAEPGKLA